MAQGNYAERFSRLSILICGARGKMPLGWNNNARSDAELGKVPGDKTLLGCLVGEIFLGWTTVAFCLYLINIIPPLIN